MNELIVWDKKNKRFLDGDEFAIDDNGIVYKWDSESKLAPFKQEMKLLKNIGKSDINGEKIYADCSIVEFDYLDLNLEDIECGRRKFVGFFKWHKDILSYCIHYDGGNKILNEVRYCPASFENFKIIDTIQENKLGLII